jgi:sulfur dioxygenase
MYFRILPDEASGAVSYLLADLDTRECVLVDARGADVPLLKAMLHEYKLRLSLLLRTHEHDAPLPGEFAALESLGAPRIQQVSSPAPTSPAGESSKLVFGNELIHVMPTPGHTAGCVSYLWRDRLFCGDLLSVDACPQQPRPAQPEAMWDSATRQVFTLPGETLLFCSHATQGRVVSNVLEQRRWHPWFGGGTRDAFLARVRAPVAEANAFSSPPTAPSVHTL